jgi:predicted RNA methylase
MLGDASPDVVDVGTGTGKLSRAVLAPGRTVVAVDLDAVMLADAS